MPDDLIASELVFTEGGHLYGAQLSETPSMPTDATSALDTPFMDLGYVGPDGIAWNDAFSKEKFYAWNVTVPIVTRLQSRDPQIGFALQQWNQDTLAIAFGGGSFTDGTYSPPTEDNTEIALVVEWEDGDYASRLVVARATLADGVSFTLTGKAPALFACTFDVLQPDSGDAWNLISELPALVLGSS